MSTFTSITENIKQLTYFNEKKSFLTVLLNYLQSQKVKISDEDKKELADFAFSEVKALLSLIPTVPTYKEKDEIFGYEDNLLGLIMALHASPAQIPQDDLNNIQALVDLVNKERFVENAINSIFEEKQNDKLDVERLICTVSPLKDEYQKGQLFRGLLHYQNNIKDLPEESKRIMADYLSSEISRYIKEPLTDDTVEILEVACDIAKHFINETFVSLLYDALKLGKNNISFYAVCSLLEAERSVPDEAVVALANDIVYADMTYSTLKMHGCASAFPAELATPEYLAKSDMVHWLTFPTELGKQPDKIELLGKVKKKEEYFVFRFMSDSENLGEDRMNKWLIGWASDEGGTFSNFDLYSDFEQKTVEKTLKKIKKKLL